MSHHCFPELLFAGDEALFTHQSYPSPSAMRDAVVAHYSTPAALNEYSRYRLFPEEQYLMGRYYRPGQTVLDHACGAGRTTLLLHEMGMRVTGVDLSHAAVAIARRRFPYLHFEQGSFTDIAAPDRSFDHVLISFNSLDVAFPETERVRALTECARVLKPGGTLLLSSHNLKSLHFSPFYVYYFPGDKWRLGWMLRNTLKAFGERAYVRDGDLLEFYGSFEYVVDQVTQHGFAFIESTGLLASHNKVFNTYASPYLHYIFSRMPTRSVSDSAGGAL